jgi:hypothetical protein
MRMPRSYVVHIYRQGYQSLSGLVEDTHSGAKQPFHRLTELIVLLVHPSLVLLILEANSIHVVNLGEEL